MYQSDDLNSILESHKVAGEILLKLYTHSGTLWHRCACSNTHHTHTHNKQSKFKKCKVKLGMWHSD